MSCLVCGSEPTIDDHLLPRCFAKEVRGELSDHVFMEADGRYRWTKTGLFDPDILCANCDNQLGSYEGYSFDTLKTMRMMTSGQRFGSAEFGPVDTSKLLRFIAGVIWKYAVTKPHLGKIGVKPSRLAKLKRVAFDGLQYPFFDAFLWRMSTGDADTWFYKAPLVGDVAGIKFVRFSVGNFQIFAKIDQRKAQDVDPVLWLRDKERIKFLISPMHEFSDFHVWFSSELENERLREGLVRKRLQVGPTPLGIARS